MDPPGCCASTRRSTAKTSSPAYPSHWPRSSPEAGAGSVPSPSRPPTPAENANTAKLPMSHEGVLGDFGALALQHQDGQLLQEAERGGRAAACDARPVAL